MNFNLLLCLVLSRRLRIIHDELFFSRSMAVLQLRFGTTKENNLFVYVVFVQLEIYTKQICKRKKGERRKLTNEKQK